MSTPHPGTPDPQDAGGQNPYGQQAAAGADRYGQPAQQAPQYDQDGAGQPGSRYGTQPYAPGAPLGATQEPSAFRRLLTLTLASAALFVLSALPGLFARPSEEELRRQIEAQPQPAGQEASPEELDWIIDLTMNVMTVGVIVSLLIGLALYALVYVPLRGAQNWARILGVVLAIPGILLTVGGLFMSLTMPGLLGILGIVLSIAFVIVNILWLVTAFRSDVAAYTKQGRRVRA